MPQQSVGKGAGRADAAALRLAEGHHVISLPPFQPAAVADALRVGLELLRADCRTVVTVVVPRWTARWWWDELVANGRPYVVIGSFASAAELYELAASRGAGQPAVAGHPLVALRLAAVCH